MRMLIKARYLIRSAQSGGGNLRMMATIIIVLLSGVFAFAIAFFVKWFVTTCMLIRKRVVPLNSAPPRTVKEFERLAQSSVPKAYWSYLSCGAGQELTVKENTAAYDRYVIRPRYLRNVSQVDMKVTLFGDEIAFPIGVCPTSPFSAKSHEGELFTTKACVDLGVLMVLSSFSSVKMEEVARSAEGRGPIWYNMLVGASIEIYREHTTRAEKSGFKAIVITIDLPLPGKTKDQILPYAITSVKFPNYNISDGKVMHAFHNTQLIDPSTTWEKIDVIRSLTHLPIILKGIMTAEDAIEAVKHNVHGIIVSNHGGRQLDGVPATIDVLSEVVSAVDNKVDVFIDGGIRKGTDVLKALALGAKAVFIGRPVIWGLEYNGLEGVKSVLSLLRNELKLAMQLSGCANLSDVRNNSVVVHESHYRGCHGRQHVQ